MSSVHGVADARVLGQDGIRDDPAISIDQTGGIDANRSCDSGTMDKQNTLNGSPTVQASVPAPTDDAGEQWLLKAVRDNALLLDKISKYLD